MKVKLHNSFMRAGEPGGLLSTAGIGIPSFITNPNSLISQEEYVARSSAEALLHGNAAWQNKLESVGDNDCIFIAFPFFFVYRRYLPSFSLS